MSNAVRNSLSNLNQALDRLDKALMESEAKRREQQQELFAAKAALNDNGGRKSSGIDSTNVEQFSLRLDNVIDKVEQILKEG